MDLLRKLELLYIRFLCSDLEKYINEISKVKLKTKKGKIIKQEKDFEKYNDVIEEFKNIAKANFTKEQYREILGKLNHLEIREIKSKTSKIRTVISLAYYDAIKNKITLEKHDNINQDDEMIRLTLLHELLHMASTRKRGKETITGLSIGEIAGTGLDEAYTEYMCEKYFNSNQGMYLTGKMDFVIKGLENIVGEKELQNYYLDGNLVGLVNNLSKYIDKKEAIKLILQIDFLSKYSYSRKTFLSIISKIARITNKRLLEDLDEGKFTSKEYKIKKSLQVDEYRKCRILENYEIIEDGNYFRIKNDDYISPPYSYEDSKTIKKVRRLFKIK